MLQNIYCKFTKPATVAAMTNLLPPLNPLRAFEAAARHLSFKLAAHELHVTQGAISQPSESDRPVLVVSRGDIGLKKMASSERIS